MPQEPDSKDGYAAEVQATATVRVFRPFEELSSSTTEPLEADVARKIAACSSEIDDIELGRDLDIRLPRLEGVDIVAALTTKAGSEESLSAEIRDYIAVLGQFNNYVGQAVEDAVVSRLNAAADEWKPVGKQWTFGRNTVQFPDIMLVDENADAVGKHRILFHIEVKTWYVFARDLITARFNTAPSCIKSDALLLVFPWYMTQLVHGVPRVLKPLVYPAKELALRRDTVWVTGVRRRNRKSRSKFRVMVPAADSFFANTASNHNVKSEAYQRKGRTWVKDSDNFGKIHRFYYQPIYDFEKRTLAQSAKGKTLNEWRRLLYG